MKNRLFLFFVYFFLSFSFLLFPRENNEIPEETTENNSHIESKHHNEESLKEVEEKPNQNEISEEKREAYLTQEEIGETDEGDPFQNKEIEDEKIDDATLATIQTIEEKAVTNIPHKRLDNEIFLFMMGYGEAKLIWTFGFEFFKGATLTQVQSPIFAQEANLSLLFLMKRRWYFGINYKDKTLDSSIYMGYINEDDAIKKHIRLGNKGINFPSIYPFIKGGKTAHLSPGASAKLEGDKWRFDSAIQVKNALAFFTAKPNVSSKKLLFFRGKKHNIFIFLILIFWAKYLASM